MEITEVKIGCDIVKIDRLSKVGKDALLKIFKEAEIKNMKDETIAGMFAAKESCRKVFNHLRWHDIVIKKLKSGKPVLSINKKIIEKNKVLSNDLSISHDGNYAIATVIFLVKRK